jgi:hypothetical protein
MFEGNFSAIAERFAALDALDRLAALQSIRSKSNIQIESGRAQRILERRI